MIVKSFLKDNHSSSLLNTSWKSNILLTSSYERGIEYHLSSYVIIIYVVLLQVQYINNLYIPTIFKIERLFIRAILNDVTGSSTKKAISFIN